jgi:hypothetical protein
MYVMAVTVQDVEYVKRCFFEPKATSMMDYVQGEFGNGGPWRKLLNENYVKEHVSFFIMCIHNMVLLVYFSLFIDF